ncbi:MAG: hypothetical protein AAGE37_03995 [Pseudomonadota bacterium]
MTINKPAVTTAIFCLLLSACSQEADNSVPAQPEPENRDIAETAFSTTDQNKDGSLDRTETRNMAENMFLSMDYDDNASVSAAEFDEWDFGLVYTAASAGQSAQYAAAKRILFALRDLNSDGEISQEEYQQSHEHDFSRADQDNDESMTKDEYATGFLPSLLFRAALEDPPAE